MYHPNGRCQHGHAHRRSSYRGSIDRSLKYDRTRLPSQSPLVIMMVQKGQRLIQYREQAEISPPHARGLLSGWTQLMIVWGFFVANW
jgi:hypothetical protein